MLVRCTCWHCMLSVIAVYPQQLKVVLTHRVRIKACSQGMSAMHGMHGQLYVHGELDCRCHENSALHLCHCEH
jgi:hypothetical protein